MIGYYTASAPGTEPEWVRCGRGAVEGSPGSSTAGSSFSCLTKEGDNWRDISAALAVVNDAPFTDEPTSDLNGSSAAITVTPFRAKLYLGLHMLDGSSPERCWRILAQVWSEGRTKEDLDQPVARVPLDFHLVRNGGRGSFALFDPTDVFRAPNASHGVAKGSGMCIEQLGRSTQFSHEGGAAHIEIVGGTTAQNDFEFGVMPKLPTDLSLRAWIDQNEDDRYQSTEKSDELIWPDDTKLALRASPNPVARGGVVELAGRNDSAFSQCIRERLTELQERNAFDQWEVVQSEYFYFSDDFSFLVDMNVDKTFRIVQPEKEGCRRAQSRPLTVDVEAP